MNEDERWTMAKRIANSDDACFAIVASAEHLAKTLELATGGAATLQALERIANRGVAVQQALDRIAAALERLAPHCERIGSMK